MYQSVHKDLGLYYAAIIADSITKFGHRLTTFVLRLPKFIVAEFNTHRLLSRNSASSRAIPFKTNVKNIIASSFIPDRFPKNHSGMSQKDPSAWYFADTPEYELLKNKWFEARNFAIEFATELNSMIQELDQNGKITKNGISKQIVNRILEPWMWTTIIVSATEWSNFLALRNSEHAQREIMIPAQLIAECMAESTPILLEGGQWHIPFGDKIDLQRIESERQLLFPDDLIELSITREMIARMIAIARCARVSYHEFDGTDSYLKDLELYNRLKDQGHWSPFEHVAQAMTDEQYQDSVRKEFNFTEAQYGWCGNFRGFIQARKMFPLSQENIV